ncbi:MAG: hypothetical protein ACOYB4_02475 [Methyloceanibacter sp.]
MRRIAPITIFVLSFGFLIPAAQAEPTEIVVRVLSGDAKFIGTSMGGVRVVLRDAQTGEILASGVTQGSTGDTSVSMHENGGRRALLSDPSAAKFTATIDLDEPRLIEAEIFGPLAQLQSATRAVSTRWVVPGRGVTAGDGWMIDLPGFVVDVLAPPAHVRIPPDAKAVDVRANVVAMCGCPITPDGLWDANNVEVKAQVSRDGQRLDTVDLAFAGEASQFAGSVPVDGPGIYEVLVYAYDRNSGNTGVDRTTFLVGR